MSFIRKKKEPDPDTWGNSWTEEEERSQSMWSKEVIKKLLRKAGLC